MADESGDDRELMARAQAGDRRAFDELVRRYQRAVYSYTRRVLRDEPLAAEACQDAFVRAYKYRSSYKAEAGPVRGWLFAVAANSIRDARRQRREGPAPLEDAAQVAASEEDGLAVFARGAVRDAVASALEALPEDMREVVAMKYVSDLSYEEVARALGISVSAAKMRALRA